MAESAQHSRDDAPADAIEVQGLNADGQLVLHHSTGAGGSFIYDAKPWAPRKSEP